MDGDEREVVAQAVLQRVFLGLLRGALVVGPDLNTFVGVPCSPYCTGLFVPMGDALQ